MRNQISYFLCILIVFIIFSNTAFGEILEYEETNDGISVTLPCSALTTSIDNCISISGHVVANDASIILEIATNNDEPMGQLSVDIPRNVLDSKLNDNDSQFFVFVDGEHTEQIREVPSSNNVRSLVISIPPGSTEVEIVGTKAIPEFPLAILIIVLTLTAVVVFTRFSNKTSFLVSTKSY